MLRKIIQKIADILFLTVAWFFVITILILPLLPLWILILTTKIFEEYVYENLYNGIRIKSEELPWLHDDPTNRTIINAMIVMEGQLNVKRLQKVIKEKLTNARNDSNKKQYPKTTRYVHSGYLNYYWIEEEKFNIKDHVFEWSTDTVTSKEDLRDLLSKLADRPLIDARKLSPWEYILINYEENGLKKTVIFLRSHHSIADGVSYIYFLITKLNERDLILKSPTYVSKFQEMLIMAKSFAYIPLTLSKMTLTSSYDHSLICHTSLSGKKNFTWSEPVRLDIIKRIKTKLNVTVNDVLVGCLATCYHNYFKENNQKPPRDLMTSFPVDTRCRLDQAKEFANKIAVMFLPLPTNTHNPLRNVREINRRMTDIKTSGDAFSVRTGMRIFAYMLPEIINKTLYNFMLAKSSMVLSNIAGPQSKVVIAGEEVDYLVFWPPPKNKIAMSLSMFTYNDAVRLGIGCDDVLMSDPGVMIKHFGAVVKELAKMVGEAEGFYSD